MRIIIYLLALLAVISSSCQVAELIPKEVYSCTLAFEDNSIDHPKSEKFSAAFKMVKSIVPGVQVAVRSKDGNLWLGAQGLADIANQVPLENCTKMMLGSVSKIYTATLIMQLQDEGVLSMDDNISKWLDREIVKEIENAEASSIKQLLNHTSGIRDYLGVAFQIEALNNVNYKLTPLEKLKFIYGKSAYFKPGEGYEYSNSNYVLLGLIIEKARNLPYDQVVDIYISQRIGLENTLSGTPKNPIPTGTARPYLAIRGGKYTDVMEFNVSDGATGDGGMASNMQEAVRFIERLADTTIVSKKSLDLMLNERVSRGYPTLFSLTNWHGLGLEQSENEHGLMFGHSGSTWAYHGHLFHFPDSKVTIAVSFNGDTEQNDKYDQILEFVLELIDIAFE